MFKWRHRLLCVFVSHSSTRTPLSEAIDLARYMHNTEHVTILFLWLRSAQDSLRGWRLTYVAGRARLKKRTPR
jgi:hypothetical protein